MTRTAVDLGALDRWSADATRVRERLGTSLTRADGVVSRLDVWWHGDASSAFADHYAEWQKAATRLAGTLDELVTLVDTAHANYRSAAGANARMWTRSTAPTIAAMSTGSGGLDADPDDLRITASALVGQRGRLDDGWRALGTALDTTAGMAGADPAAVGFGADHDTLAAAAWSGWRAACEALTALADTVAATGNNVLVAEHASTAGGPAPPELIPGSPPVASAPPAPPAVAGASAEPPSPFGDAWPTGDADRLVAAAHAWRTAAGVLWDVSVTTASTVDAAAAGSPSLAPMREYVDAVVRDECVGGHFATLRAACGRLATACEQLADQIVRTREELRAAVADLLDGEEWYHPVGQVLDAVLTRGLAERIALAGDLTMFHDAVALVRTEHERAVARIREGLATAADELLRAAAAVPRPAPVAADVTSVVPVLGPGVRRIAPPPLILNRAQVEKKYADHAADFGVTAPRGKDGFARLESAVRAVVSDPATVHVDGTYRSEPVVIHLEPRRHLVVLQHHDGTFISGWELNPAQEANIIERGSL